MRVAAGVGVAGLFPSPVRLKITAPVPINPTNTMMRTRRKVFLLGGSRYISVADSDPNE